MADRIVTIDDDPRSLTWDQLRRLVEILRSQAAAAGKVAEADRALVDCIIGVGLEGMKPRRAGDPVCPEGYILVGLPFYDACRAARAQEQETSMNAAEGGDAPRSPLKTHSSNPAPSSASPLQGLEGSVGSVPSRASPGPLAAAQLLPCPFCGGEAKLVHADQADYKAHWYWFVECQECGLDMSNEFDSDAHRDRLVEDWNRRTPQPCTDPKHAAAVRLAEAIMGHDEPGKPCDCYTHEGQSAEIDAYRAACAPVREEPVLSAEAIAKLHGIGDKMDDTGYLARVLLIMASDLQRALDALRNQQGRPGSFHEI